MCQSEKLRILRRRSQEIEGTLPSYYLTGTQAVANLVAYPRLGLWALAFAHRSGMKPALNINNFVWKALRLVS